MNSFTSRISLTSRMFHRYHMAAMVSCISLLSFSPAFAQGTLTTNDGLKLSLSSTGSVSGLQLGATSYASTSLVSGFAYREAFPSLSGGFGSAKPTPFSGKVTSSSGVVTQTDSRSGFTLQASYTSVGSAVKVDA